MLKIKQVLTRQGESSAFSYRLILQNKEVLHMWVFCLLAFVLGVNLGFVMTLFFVGIRDNRKYPREPPSPETTATNRK